MPLTTGVIQQVYAIERMYVMPKGLKIKNKTGLVLYDASKTAGMDYVQDTEDYNESDKSETESKTDSDDDKSKSSKSST